MGYLDTLKNKHITVLGLGVTGLGIVRFLVRHGITPKVVDSRPVPPGADWMNHNLPECEAVFGPLAEAALSATDLVVISRVYLCMRPVLPRPLLPELKSLATWNYLLV